MHSTYHSIPLQQAYGFKLNNLDKLLTTKSSKESGEIPLIRVVASFVEFSGDNADGSSSILHFGAEWLAVIAAQKISSKELNTKIETLESQLQPAVDELRIAKTEEAADVKSDNSTCNVTIIRRLEVFLESAQSRLKSLKSRHVMNGQSIADILKRFGESEGEAEASGGEASRDAQLEFFKTMYSFGENFRSAVSLNRKIREDQRRKELKLAKAKKNARDTTSALYEIKKHQQPKDIIVERFKDPKTASAEAVAAKEFTKIFMVNKFTGKLLKEMRKRRASIQ